MSQTERESVDTEAMKVLQECVELMRKKGNDYQNPNSNVVQAMHYRRGVDSIHDTMHGKMLRAQSLLESGSTANFESLEDTYKDLINYASFAVSYIRGKMEGQTRDRDFLNRPKMPIYVNGTSVSSAAQSSGVCSNNTKHSLL